MNACTLLWSNWRKMHRPDGVPDTVEQVTHGALLILEQE
jgi:hypothetical protein